MKHNAFDVIIVGGGHAGCEAALAAQRMGSQVALITHRRDRIGEMSCNPAIGGLGKGHLVREIDALDGVMGRVADRSGIQFRLLNRRKGPAVQGPRTQADRDLYRRHMQAEFDNLPNLAVIEAAVDDLIIAKGKIAGVTLADGSEISAAAVVITTGTFLRGVIHIGTVTRQGGRMGDPATSKLAQRIEDLGLPLGRLKTGTPPRLKSKSINWEILERQEADENPVRFSFLNSGDLPPQIACGITHTNEATHELIRKNLEKSAMYSGNITGPGPRYCPSIEDKVTRFSDKSAHQVFLEPEGLNSDLVYPNGISTSLPLEIQEQYVTSMRGLEFAEIVQPGYAIEYDYVDPRALDSTLRVINCPGLFLAGQINGTTGYEEAAAQGLIAGLNAALSVAGAEPFILDRSQAYIGVMIDDLVTRGVAEPYRMFTSRAEYRLSLRADNADQRLTPLGMEIGCISRDRAEKYEDKATNLADARFLLSGRTVTPDRANAVGLRVNRDGHRRSVFDLMARSETTPTHIVELCPESSAISSDILSQLSIDATYASYIERQGRDIAALKRDAEKSLPLDLPYQSIAGLSTELKTKLLATRPDSIAQASRIEGMTPAALGLLIAATRRAERKSA
ncbi:tRNA uridine-5-carboxymethylaminomethyl(34) synthesis enzyme MnmG [Pontivivens nitratireducens]|uniref:tRNA uridine 5-carboxymethylaminomethyl modification enzyme MnmG n=1 Tax=Pontivivens nitratireducens TaxID=2758038 RepID=A0A6G7VIG9_9RHOB|nr:tRNA uridine-5-carboxymethylaminomethyl(34) synthesis enzyme MnmG [Pontibrevibacter nitratireducens]QIK39821.1 tRNA uridine-5-carboxymethylaminomethyl(34) synthesis enzyme MnmG [Pontibrevibacter nitratireducens]